MEDFVDEDTGEVVSIERTEIVIPRETVLEESHIADIIESGVQNILLHKEDSNTSDYSIIFNTLQKDSSNSEKKPCCIFIANYVTPSLPMMPVPAR